MKTKVLKQYLRLKDNINNNSALNKYYDYVEYSNKNIVFSTYKIFEDIVDEILTNPKFTMLYSRDSDINIRNLCNYSKNTSVDIEFLDSVKVIDTDILEYDLHVSTFNLHEEML